MGTRGLFGIAIDDTVKVSYNHWDSYPSGLGVDMVRAVDEIASSAESFATYCEAARQTLLVEQGSHPTPEQIERLREHADTGVAGGNVDDWYVLLRKLQGDLLGSLKAGVMIDGFAFGGDSLFCEWGYVIDLDNKCLEVYRGFQQQPHNEGRWAKVEPDSHSVGTYYPIKLVARLSFEETTEKAMTLIEADIYGGEED